MNPPDFPPSPAPYRDRKTGLIVFGFFTVLFGLCAAAFVPLAVFGQMMSAKSGAPTNEVSIIPAVMIYGVLGVTLIWLGIGSMMTRRWARALLLIFSWSWLLTGIVSLGMMIYLLPQMSGAFSAGGQADPNAGRIVMIISMAIMGIFFILIPGIWLLFYRSPHVKATCAALDPVERWTDRCPLPVLAICIWLAFTVPMMAVMGFVYHGVVPVFGTLVTGVPGTAIYLALAAAWAYCAWSLYRLQSIGWWILVVSFVLFGISAFITYSRHDIGEVYRLMGYSEAMLAEMEKFTFIRGKAMAWASVSGLPFILGYMIFVRRYLRS